MHRHAEMDCVCTWVYVCSVKRKTEKEMREEHMNETGGRQMREEHMRQRREEHMRQIREEHMTRQRRKHMTRQEGRTQQWERSGQSTPTEAGFPPLAVRVVIHMSATPSAGDVTSDTNTRQKAKPTRVQLVH